MNILWISDGKKGHEKQVEILLNEISKTVNTSIEKQIYSTSLFVQIVEFISYASSICLETYF